MDVDACNRIGHCCTQGEFEFAMGWPAIVNTGNLLWKNEVHAANENLFIRQRRQLIFGSIMLPMLYSWLVYVHAHTVQREFIMVYHTPANTSTNIENGPNDDGEFDLKD